MSSTWSAVCSAGPGWMAAAPLVADALPPPEGGDSYLRRVLCNLGIQLSIGIIEGFKNRILIIEDVLS